MQESNIVQDTVNILPICPKCHEKVRPTDYFCFNCGTNLHKAPLSTSGIQQITYYLGSVIVFPMGFIWGMRYLRQQEDKSKFVGIVCIIISVIVLILLIQGIFALFNAVNSQMSTTLQNYGGL